SHLARHHARYRARADRHACRAGTACGSHKHSCRYTLSMAAPRAAGTPRYSRTRIALGIVMALIALTLLVQFWFFCKVVWYSMQPPGSTPIMRAAMSQLRKTQPDAELQYHWVDYDRISPGLKRAVIAAEDATFLEH